MPLSGSLGERIAKLRTENRISQKELADLLYVNQGTVSRWEKGTRFPEEDLIYKMAERFGVDPEVLLSASTERTPVILLVDQEKELAKLVPLMEKLVPEAKIFGASSVKRWCSSSRISMSESLSLRPRSVRREAGFCLRKD